MSFIVLQFNNPVPGVVTEFHLPFTGLTGILTLTASNGQSLTWTEDYPYNPFFVSDVSSGVLTITGTFTQFGDTYSAIAWRGHEFLTMVLDWGSDGTWNSLSYGFYNCLQLVDLPSFLPSSVVRLENICNMIPNTTLFTSPTVYPSAAFQGNGVKTWNTSLVQNMSKAFAGCNQMDVSLGGWSLASIDTVVQQGHSGPLESLLDLTALSSTHYEETLQGWLSNPNNVPLGITLGVAGLSTTIWSATKNTLSNLYGWTIIESNSTYYYSTYSITLNYGIQYSAYIAAQNAVGLGPTPTFSTLIQLIAQPADPPSNLSLSFLPRNPTVRLFWTPPANLHGSILVSYLLRATPFSGSPLTVVPPFYNITLDYDISYSFQVASVSQITKRNPTGGGTTTTTYISNYTEPPIVFSLPFYPSEPPSNVTVVSTGIQQVEVSWVAPVNTYGNTVVGYAVQIQLTNTVTPPLYLTTTSTSIDIVGLLTNVSYSFSVQTLVADSQYNSIFSPPVTFTIYEAIAYYTPKRTATYANISTALRYSQYLQQFKIVSSVNLQLTSGPV